MKISPGHIKRILKIAMSAVLLTIVLTIVDRATLLHTLQAVPLETALLLILGYLLSQVISAYKWWYIARSSNVRASFPRAVKSYFVGMFVNCFGLGLIGGDVARGVLLAGKEDTKTRSIATVIADRAHGLAVLAGIGTCATLAFGSATLDREAMLILTGIGSAVIAGWLLGPKILLRVVSRENRLRTKAEDVARAFPGDPLTIIHITLISISFHLLQIGLHWVMGAGFGASLSFSLLLVAVPFINIVSALPISWNGVGFREAGYVFFLAGNGITQEQAVAFGALWLLATTVSSLIGGLLGVVTNDFQALRVSLTRNRPGGAPA